VDRVFLDANVLYSAAIMAESVLGQLWNLDGILLITSWYAMEEAKRALDEDSQQERLQKLSARMEVADAQVMAVPATTDPPDLVPIEIPEKDRPILAGAMDLRATHLLTGDRKHFGRYYGQRVRGVLIMKPAEYLRQRQGKTSGNE
jgi:uncharacterized protein